MIVLKMKKADVKLQTSVGVKNDSLCAINIPTTFLELDECGINL